VAISEPPAPEIDTPARPPANERTYPLDRQPQAASICFGIVLALAFGLYLWAGRNKWFFLDEWDFLVNRTGGRVADLLEPHAEHWTTIPIVLYRLLFNVFGLRTYVPYQLLAITAHLTAAVLLRIVMRRAGASPWIATVAASAFVLFGSGDANILRGFQIAFDGALVFGLVQLLLADHDGPVDRRDAFALVAGLAGLMCSGIALAMVAGVGVAMFVRRGWRVALLQTVPLYAVYLVWWLAFGRDEFSRRSSSVSDITSFMATSVRATVDALGQIPVVGWALVVVALVGLVMAWGHPGRSDVRRRAALPLGLLAALATFLLTTAISRAFHGPHAAEHSRYLHIVAALSVAALAVGVDAFARRWTWSAPLVIVLLLVGVPGNLDIVINQKGEGRATRPERDWFTTAAHMELPGEIPLQKQIDPANARFVTLGWLRDQAARGNLSRPRPDPDLEEMVRFRLSLQQDRVNPPVGSCEPLTEPREIHLEAGQSFGFYGPRILARLPRYRNDMRARLELGQASGRTVVALAGPLDFSVQPFVRGEVVQVCGLR
jgi:hypothetical protein